MSCYQQYLKTLHSVEAKRLVHLINEVNLKELSLSKYNLDYIEKMKPTLFYFFQMFEFSIQKLNIENSKEVEWIIDFGGGHGFLSLLLKLKGYKVIYCDYNSNSVHTINQLSNKLGFGPDYVVEGTSKELIEFVQHNKINVKYLISTDTIEHIFDLNDLFKDLIQLNNSINLLFTTASNPKNIFKSYQLRKVMRKDEVEEFIPLRKEFIQTKHTQLSISEVNDLAIQSRGLRLIDLDDFVAYYLKNKKIKVIDIDPFNCCDPVSGSWTERILPLEDYKELGRKYKLNCEIENGFYCTIDKTGMKKKFVEGLNYLNLNSNHIGRITAPFVTLHFKSK